MSTRTESSPNPESESTNSSAAFSTPSAPKWLGVLGAFWAVIGLSLLLGFAAFRLGKKAMEAWGMNADWEIWHWFVLGGWLVFMGYSEGYKGFQKAFSPRAAARTRVVRDRPTWLRVLFAPLFIMCFFDATKKRLIIAYVLTAMIIGFILLFRLIGQPLKGILDAGVVFGLSWGLVSYFYFLVPALTKAAFGVDPEVAQTVAGSQ